MDDRYKEFAKSILYSLIPDRYKGQSKKSYKDAFQYLLSILLVFFVIASILTMPKLLILPSYLLNQSGKITQFDLNPALLMSGPIIITEKSPLIIIDTTGNFTNLTMGKVLITDKNLFYKDSFRKTRAYGGENFSDITTHKSDLVKLVLWLIILTLPAVLIIVYFLFFVKYLLIIIISSLLAFVLTRLLKFILDFKEIVMIAFYSTTVMAFLEIIAIPLGISGFLFPIPVIYGISLSLVPLTLFLIYFLLGIITVGEKVS